MNRVFLTKSRSQLHSIVYVVSVEKLCWPSNIKTEASGSDYLVPMIYLLSIIYSTIVPTRFESVPSLYSVLPEHFTIQCDILLLDKTTWFDLPITRRYRAPLRLRFQIAYLKQKYFIIKVSSRYTYIGARLILRIQSYKYDGRKINKADNEINSSQDKWYLICITDTNMKYL